MDIVVVCKKCKPPSPYTLGVIYIVLVAVIWSIASVLVKHLYDIGFGNPFLLTYVGGSLFTLLLLPLACEEHQQQQQAKKEEIPSHGDYLEYSQQQSQEQQQDKHTQPWTIQEHREAASKLFPLWFLGNYSYYASLHYIPIASSTVFACTGSLFAFLFALVLRQERFSWWKLSGVALGLVGSILTAIHDEDRKSSTSDENDGGGGGGGNDSEIGDLLGLLSAIGMGGYAVLLRFLCPQDESRIRMPLVLGFMGMWNTIVMSPIAIWQFVTIYSDVSKLLIACLLAKGLHNVLSDYLWARAVMLTSATVANVGLGISIPMAFVSDFAMGQAGVWNPASIFGAFSVLFGFAMVNVDEEPEQGDPLLPETTKDVKVAEERIT